MKRECAMRRHGRFYLHVSLLFVVCLLGFGTLSAYASTLTLTVPPEAAQPIDAFSFGTPPPHSSLHDITFTLPLGPLELELQKDLVTGKHIPTMILTASSTKTTAVEEFTFSDDIVTKVVFGGSGPSQLPTANVTVDYVTLTINFSGGGPPVTTPEPASLLLLGTGLGLARAIRRTRLA